MNKQLFSSFLIFFISSLLCFGQGNTDLIAIDVKKSGKKISLGHITKLTNRDGYDNQPSFINDKQLAFSSSDQEGNFDIIIYNFETEKFTNLTKTKDQNEYSPRLTDCGLYVSAVTVEESGKQRLWLYPTNFGEPELLYDDIEPVGYYDWYDNKAAMFVLGRPNSLIYPYSKEDKLTISQNIGRTVRRQPKTSIISFIDKNTVIENDGEQSYSIKGFDIEKRKMIDLGPTKATIEDFIWLDKNHLLSSDGYSLYVRKYNENQWSKLGDLSIDGYKNISRLAYSKKLRKIIIVMDRVTD
ncbi:hypothetical protein SAMN06295967_10457 [Belliella buryatensis]|uniref:WD40-like Beta Propeller Repeat n=1 Tax=Belliella buryatensis TaxID=1500549 RepID=A0A239C382_9BACT|nr:hypothetical protein [Belliella buryatensis]SNS14636.1 hypothetical protein SAMN06295967_10457 [Belliella buryatensis]